MCISSRLCCFILACIGVVAVAGSDASGIVEVDLVFPRNDTYAPAPIFPIIFAFQKPSIALFLNPIILVTVWDRGNMTNSVLTTSYDLKGANLSSSDPYLAHRGLTRFNKEGTWMLTWTVNWDSCTRDALESPSNSRPIVSNTTDNSVTFTTRGSSQEVDLVSSTNNKDCGANQGLNFNVTDTLKVPSRVDWSGGETCAVVALSAPKPDPCRVKIDSAAASSIFAAATAQICEGISPSISCPSEDGDENAGQRLVVGGIVCLAAGLGAIFHVFA
ncbi:hypothetical protein CcaCcLH18_10538 [Colletotrichum camelliae]|nr:hypothetical protein CcaCcLH18_10538 [Colletotrichum camelliae]